MEDLIKMKELRDLSIKTLKSFLERDDFDKAALDKARVALSAISTYSRVKQTARTWASMRYLAARELIERKEDFEEYGFHSF